MLTLIVVPECLPSGDFPWRYSLSLRFWEWFTWFGIPRIFHDVGRFFAREKYDQVQGNGINDYIAKNSENPDGWDAVWLSDPAISCDIDHLWKGLLYTETWSTSIKEVNRVFQDDALNDGDPSSHLEKGSIPRATIITSGSLSGSLYGVSREFLQGTWRKGQKQVAEKWRALWLVDTRGEHALMQWSQTVFQELLTMYEDAEQYLQA